MLSAMKMDAPQPETKQAFCRICEPLCGLEVTLADGKVQDITIKPVG